MKTTRFVWIVLVIVTAGLLAFSVLRAPAGGSIRGTVTPANAALKASAIADTAIFQSNIINGAFEIKDVKPGTYRVEIEASLPFKKAVREGIVVNNGKTTDIGQIRLQD
jgi:Polysaccharide lyase family 4, domain II